MKTLSELIFSKRPELFDQDCIDHAINNLPADNAKVVRLHFIDRIPRKEIASRLNWSLGKVNNKITRGITLLKHQLNPQYYSEIDKTLKFLPNISSGNGSEHS